MTRPTEGGRLRWRCRRGMRELDAVLVRFLETEFESLGPAEKAGFAAILELPDPTIHAYLLGRREPEEPDVAAVIAALRRAARPAP